MESITRLAPERGRDAPAWKPDRKAGRAHGWSDWLMGAPITLFLAAVILLLALPGLLRPRGRRWDRYGEH